MTTWAPDTNYRDVLRRGDSGWDVGVCQAALNGQAFGSPNLVLDGSFGPMTEGAVKNVQAALKIKVDGVLGPETMWRFCKRECAVAETNRVPHGAVQGICWGESNGIIPTTTGRYQDGSRDYFALQDNLLNPTQEELRNAANVRVEAIAVAIEILGWYNYLKGFPQANTPETGWKLAILAYNWPAAAKRIAKGERFSWGYWEPDGKGRIGKQGEPGAVAYKLSDPAPWVEQYKIPGVTTGWDWCQHYINAKVIGPDPTHPFITSWTV